MRSPGIVGSLAALGLLIAAGCVKSYVEPADRLFPAGRYDYHARLLLPGSADSANFRGVLALDAVAPDSLHGRWEVPGYEPELRENHFNVVAFNVHARIGAGPDSLTAIHSIERGPSGAPACSVRATRTGYLAQGRCSLRLLP